MRAAPPEDRQRIIDLYKSGMTRPAIASETGWSEGTVHNIIKASGVVGTGRVTGIRTDPETEALVLELYDQGITWREIMDRVGRTEHTVQAILRRNDRGLDRKKPLLAGDWQKIISLYENGTDAPDIAGQFGCHTSMVYYVLEHSGIKRREQIACDNPRYFDAINTPDKAYWLGFIGADGCVRRVGANALRLQVKLARKDRAHLLILHKAIRAARPVRDFEAMSKGKVRPYSILDVCSTRLCEALVSHGIVPRKTNALEPWGGPEHLMPHYWRGLIDGDGSITINHNGVYVSFVGSESVVRGFLAWAHEVCGTNSQPRQGTMGNRRYWTTQIGGTVRILSLLAALYDDAPVALARKKALADLAVHGKPLQHALF